MALKQIISLKNVSELSAGFHHCLALRKDGTVWAWGGNEAGQCGRTNTNYLSIPTRIRSLSNVKAIAAGSCYSLALKKDGTVWAWGLNDSGQLGDGTRENRTEPVRVKRIGNVMTIAAGEKHSLAVLEDGTVWSWGDNKFGQLGDDSNTSRTEPTPVKGIDNVLMVACGDMHSIALKKDRSVWTWGCNEMLQMGQCFYPQGLNTEGGEFGNPERMFESDFLVPFLVTGLRDIVSVSAGKWHSMALTKNGLVLVWGDNSFGQSGDGTLISRDCPDYVKNLAQTTKIWTRDNQSIAITADGTVSVWGLIEIGENSVESRVAAQPTSIKELYGALTVVKANVGGYVMLKKDRTVWKLE